MIMYFACIQRNINSKLQIQDYYVLISTLFYRKCSTNHQYSFNSITIVLVLLTISIYYTIVETANRCVNSIYYEENQLWYGILLNNKKLILQKFSRSVLTFLFLSMRNIINKILIQNPLKYILPKNGNPKYNFKNIINPLFANISSIKVIITIDVINGYTLSRQVFSISFFSENSQASGNFETQFQPNAATLAIMRFKRT